MSDELYYIWLSLACGAGSAAPQRLLGAFETAGDVYAAPKDELEEKYGAANGDILDRLCDKDTGESEKILESCAKNNVSILHCDSKLYPKRLRGIRAFPVVLYYKGRLPDIDDNLCVAMVGTRKMTDYGKHAAYELARELASCGAVIISGMAEGIDTASHKGCLVENGFTIAVLGCGTDKVYPYENKALMDKIIEKGLVMTEYPPGTGPKGFHFPVRNRIISGLSQAVLVVEADHKSGALITARTALFQGRELYAVPGNINSKGSAGTNGLIKNRAGIVTEAYDILSEYEHLYSHRINIEKTKYYNNKNNYEPKKENKTEENNVAESEVGAPRPKPEAGLSEKLSELKIILNDSELKVFEVFYAKKDGKFHADGIKLDMPVSELMNTLTFLEIYGIITSLPGDYYKISDSFMGV